MTSSNQAATNRIPLGRMAWFVGVLCVGCCAAPLAAVISGLSMGGTMAMVYAMFNSLGDCAVPLALVLTGVAAVMLVDRLRRRRAVKACAMGCQCCSSGP